MVFSRDELLNVWVGYLSGQVWPNASILFLRVASKIGSKGHNLLWSCFVDSWLLVKVFSSFRYRRAITNLFFIRFLAFISKNGMEGKVELGQLWHFNIWNSCLWSQNFWMMNVGFEVEGSVIIYEARKAQTRVRIRTRTRNMIGTCRHINFQSMGDTTR